jgi:hypothetical protein
VCAIGLSLFAFASPRDAGAQTFRGDSTYEATKRSIDVVGAHLTFLQTQARKQDVLSYYGFTLRWAPGKFEYSDGQTAAGILSRGQQNFGFGFGDLQSGGGFVGAQVDAVSAFSKQKGTWRASAYEGLIFAGAALFGVQATLGYMGTFTTPKDFGLDATGGFAVPHVGADSGRRPGAPDLFGRDVASNFVILSAYDSGTGAFLSASWGAYPILRTEETSTGLQTSYVGRERRLSEVRANLQPLKRYLPKDFGLPMVGLTKLDPAKDNYQEKAKAPDKPTDTRNPYEIEVGSDDILAGGFRVHAIAQAYPSVFLRRAEFGYVEEFRRGKQRLRLGARGQAFQRAGGFEGSVDAYALYAIGPAQVGASYSYNSPDGTTFIPVPNAHVFGIQVLFGEPETSRPLIPLVRVIEEKQKEKKEGSE